MAYAKKQSPDASEIQCGAFYGLTFEYFDKDGFYCRAWLLTLAELLLHVDYFCEARYKDRDREFIDGLLSTLRDARP